MALKDRLLIFMQEAGLTAGAIAELAQVQASAVSHIISGRNLPGCEFLTRLSEKRPDLDLRWLLTGEKGSDPVEVVGPPHSSSHEVQGSLREGAIKNELFAANGNDAGANCGNCGDPGQRIDRIIIVYGDNTFTELRTR